LIVGGGIGGGELRVLAERPRPAAPRLDKDVGGAARRSPVVVEARSDQGRTARDRYGEAELIAGVGVGGGELRVLAERPRPAAPGLDEDVGGATRRPRVIVVGRSEASKAVSFASSLSAPDQPPPGSTKT